MGNFENIANEIHDPLKQAQNIAVKLDENDQKDAAQDAGLATKLDAAKLVAYDSAASIGGGASEALTVTGLLGTDTILAVSQKTPGANGTALTNFGAPGAGSLTVGWTADPGAGAVVRVLVKKA